MRIATAPRPHCVSSKGLEFFSPKLTFCGPSDPLTRSGLFFAKSLTGFKISKIRQHRVTCYMDEFRRRTQLLRSTGELTAHGNHLTSQ